MHDSYKLLTFNAHDVNVNSKTDDWKKNEKEFLIQMFGINEKGDTVAIFVTGYTPFFYIKVGDNWTNATITGLAGQIRTDMGKYYSDSIVSVKLIDKKTLYGFDGGKNHKFVLIKFKTEAAMRKAKGLWYLSKTTKEGGYKRTLKEEGYEYGGVGTTLYEAQIPPLLRMFHIRQISPSGWIALPENSYLKHKTKTTYCDYEYTINYDDIKPLNINKLVVVMEIFQYQ